MKTHHSQLYYCYYKHDGRIEFHITRDRQKLEGTITGETLCSAIELNSPKVEEWLNDRKAAIAAYRMIEVEGEDDEEDR